MPDFSTFLKNLLPKRLRHYEAIAEAAIHQLRITPIVDEARVRQWCDEVPRNLSREGVSSQWTSDFLEHVARMYCRAVKTTLGITPYETQLVAGLAMADGHVVEMGTGEGKTLVAPFVAWLAHLRGLRVHVVTANEYLAQRDATQLAPLYNFLRMPVAVALAGQDVSTKRQAYQYPVVYGTANVFALDMLHDDQVVHPKLRLRGHKLSDTLAIVDEVDQVLIDEAKNPVVFSASAPADANLYAQLLELTEPLERAHAPAGTVNDASEGDFWLDLEDRSAVLTDRGYDRVTAALRDLRLLGDADPDYGATHQHQLYLVCVALGARELLKRETHYTVQDGQLVLIDPVTGRLLPGRRWDSGLQQLLEAKEGLEVTDEAIVRGRISLQNYFKLYGGLVGMSGTVMTEAEEFQRVYGLRAIAVPPWIRSRRVDLPDHFVRTEAEKVKVVLEKVNVAQSTARPTLIVVSHGEQASLVASALTAQGYKVRVLTAANHAEEASILARAGEIGAITVTTILAGRGVDIKLGGEGLELVEYLRGIYEKPLPADLSPEDRCAQQSAAVALTAELEALTELFDQAPSFLHFTNTFQQAYDAAEKLADLLRYFVPGHLDLAKGREALNQLLAKDLFRKRYAVFAQHKEGLLVIGFEHFETARADQQMRGRAGRQGDQGTTVFLTSLDDTLLAETGSGEELRRLLHTLGAKAGDALEEKLVRKLIIQEQRQAHERAASVRQQLVKFDATLEVHRRTFQDLRARILHEADGALDLGRNLLVEYAEHMGQILDERGDEGVAARLVQDLGFMAESLPGAAQLTDFEQGDLEKHLILLLQGRLSEILARMPQGPDQQTFLRFLVLSQMDLLWAHHLDEMTSLRRGIHLRGHAKQDPHIVFQKEAFALFEHLLAETKDQVRLALLTWSDFVPGVSQADEDTAGAPADITV